MLYRDRDWIWCDFMLGPECPEDIEFDVGQPVSVGLSQLKIGSRGTYLREVSIVRRGAVPGAEITRRWKIPETPPPPARRTPGTWPAGAIVRDLGNGAEEILYPHGVGAPIVRRNIGKVLGVR